MAFTAGGFLLPTFVDQFDDTALSVDWTSEVDLMAAFFTDAASPNYSTDTAYGSGGWATGNESSGAGYSAGGIPIIGTTLAIVSGIVRFDADNFSLPNSTIVAAGYLAYDNSTSDRGIVGVPFGGEEETQDGTFLVTHDAAGIAALDLIP